MQPVYWSGLFVYEKEVEVCYCILWVGEMTLSPNGMLFFTSFLFSGDGVNDCVNDSNRINRGSSFMFRDV